MYMLELSRHAREALNLELMMILPFRIPILFCIGPAMDAQLQTKHNATLNNVVYSLHSSHIHTCGQGTCSHDLEHRLVGWEIRGQPNAEGVNFTINFETQFERTVIIVRPPYGWKGRCHVRHLPHPSTVCF